MYWINHAFRWGYGFGILALLGAILYRPFIPVVHADQIMTATMLLNLAKSNKISEQALATGYVVAIHDELSGKESSDPTCFAVPKNTHPQEMVIKVTDFIDWVHDQKGWPKDHDYEIPAKNLVHAGLVEHFACRTI